MKRYHLFAGEHYYPGGGHDDYIGMFDSLEAAKARGVDLCDRITRGYSALDWYHICIVREDGSLWRVYDPDAQEPDVD